jgi:hypothetical protein
MMSKATANPMAKKRLDFLSRSYSGFFLISMIVRFRGVVRY